MAIRIGRGYEKIHHPYQELYEGVRPSIQGLRAAKFLPIAMLDKLHDDDPIVLLPGTWVGRLSATGTNFTAGTLAMHTAEAAARALVPAAAGMYNTTYSTHDVDFGTYNVTGNDFGVTAAATESAVRVTAVKPIGVVTAPVYSELLKTKYTNYSRDLMPSILMGNYAVVIPAITNGERAIEPGDVVRVDGGTLTISTGVWNATLPDSTDHVPGRLIAWDGTAATAGYVVGRCVDKYVVAQGSASTKMSADTVAAFSGLNTDQQFNTLKKVQTVPGLGLSGSGTQGIPAMFEHSVSDSSGNYYALVIKVDL